MAAHPARRTRHFWQFRFFVFRFTVTLLRRSPSPFMYHIVGRSWNQSFFPFVSIESAILTRGRYLIFVLASSASPSSESRVLWQVN